MLFLFTEALSEGLGSLEARFAVTVSFAAVTVNSCALISEVTSSSAFSSTSSASSSSAISSTSFVSFFTSSLTSLTSFFTVSSESTAVRSSTLT